MEYSFAPHYQPSPPPMMNFSKREIFFRTLATNLKEANKHYSGKTTTWKNPFLYKTTLCGNYCVRSYCRYGVNCWYAHGIHELRCIPESEELPNPSFIAQYLSFLGLPKHILDGIIANAYQSAQFYAGVMSYMSSTKNDPEMPSLESPAVKSPSDGLPAIGKAEQFTSFKSPWSGNTSSSDDTPSMDPPPPKVFSLFDGSYPSAFGLPPV